jgi:hypothetical protein
VSSQTEIWAALLLDKASRAFDAIRRRSTRAGSFK